VATKEPVKGNTQKHPRTGSTKQHTPNKENNQTQGKPKGSIKDRRNGNPATDKRPASRIDKSDIGSRTDGKKGTK
jgi:hypothetical protein